jgi:GMP synthase PP-ATPase subunit
MKENKEDINDLIESKFYCSRKFSEEIEKIVKENKDMKYIDAIVFFCEENGVDVESIPKLLSKPLKERLKCEAIDLNLLKKTSRAKLPL